MIEQAQLEQVAQLVDGESLGDEIAARLRVKWPDIHFTYCLDDDIAAARPVHEADGFNLYLVSGDGGCISFTSSLAQATGIVVAEIEDWEVT